MTEVSASGADKDSTSSNTAAKGDTPHVLDELSKKNNAKSKRRKRNGFRRFLIVLLLLAPLLLALIWLGVQQSATSSAIAQLQQRADELGSQVTQVPEYPEIEIPTIPEDLVNTQALSALQRNLEARINSVASAYANLQESVNSAREQREDPQILWTESEYLLRLANQKLQIEGDRNSAILLLESVDEILSEADNPALMNVREAIASELVSVRAMSGVDVSGLYLQLENLLPLVDQVTLRDTLRARYDERVAQEQRDIKASEAGAIDKIVSLLSSIFVWQKREEPIEAPLPNQDQLILKQNLRLMLEQAQIAVLQEEQAVYQSSINKAGQWLSRFFTIDDGAGRTLREELDSLATKKVVEDKPDISRSLNLLRQASNRQLPDVLGGSN
ncbi:MAG: uroporphyrinogen-III C-methyltransferase [Pseudohongiellaceae bacterium]|nr:uroporphyrinogen-III C-methyltransferase [Pseudohongiellaceae bacterium]